MCFPAFRDSLVDFLFKGIEVNISGSEPLQLSQQPENCGRLSLVKGYLTADNNDKSRVIQACLWNIDYLLFQQ